DTPQEVAELVKQEFNIEIDRRQCENYDPTKYAGRNLGKKLADLFNQTRKKFDEGLIDIPIASKYYRLKQYQKQLEKTKNAKLALKILEQAAKDVGGQFTNRQEITGKDGEAVQPTVVHATQDQVEAAVQKAQEEYKMDLQTQVEKKLCEDEHLYFTRRFFKPRMGFKFTVNWHHVYISWIIDQVIAGEIANVVINVPPGAGKTELTTNLIPRGLALNARSRFLYLSFSQSLVEGVSDTARDIVKSKDYRQMWDLTVSNSTDSKKEWKITVEDYDVGHVYVASMG